MRGGGGDLGLHARVPGEKSGWPKEDRAADEIERALDGLRMGLLLLGSGGRAATDRRGCDGDRGAVVNAPELRNAPASASEGEDPMPLSLRDGMALMDELRVLEAADTFRGMAKLRNRLPHACIHDPVRTAQRLNEAYSAAPVVLRAPAAQPTRFAMNTRRKPAPSCRPVSA